MKHCPHCGQYLPEEDKKVEYLDPPQHYAVFLDGERMNDVVAFDRREGAVWGFLRGPDGRLAISNGDFIMEKRLGEVRIEKVPEIGTGAAQGATGSAGEGAAQGRTHPEARGT